MKRKIIASVWKSPFQQGRQIGIVAAQTDEHLPESLQTWQAYIGIVNFPIDEKKDSQLIADVGARLSAQEAHGFFPTLNIKEYKVEK